MDSGAGVEHDSAGTSALGALEKAVVLLRRIGNAGPERLSELARNLQMSKTTAHRILRVLQDCEMVIHTDAGFILGPPLIDHYRQARAASRFSASRLIVPYLTELHIRTGGATVGLASLSDGRALFLRTVYGKAGLVDVLRSSQRAPAHCTAAGKTLLAYLPPDAPARGPGGVFRRYTPSTIIDAKALGLALGQVRRRGVALSLGEYVDGVHAVAAPVVDRNGERTMAISVGGRADELDLPGATALVRRAAFAASLTIRAYRNNPGHDLERGSHLRGLSVTAGHAEPASADVRPGLHAASKDEA